MEDIPVVLTDPPEVIRTRLGLKPVDTIPESGPRKWAMRFGFNFSHPDYILTDESEVPIDRGQRETWKAVKCTDLRKASKN
jgi:hypothetical protein